VRSDAGQRAARDVETGDLVPDGVVTDVIEAQIQQVDLASVILLDGFPRTIRQAELLEQLRPRAMRLAIELVVLTATLLRRLASRGRQDDTPTVILHRLASYQFETRPLLSWFAARGVLAALDGGDPPDIVSAAARTCLARHGIAPADLPVDGR
jgi:adenylate kinase